MVGLATGTEIAVEGRVDVRWRWCGTRRRGRRRWRRRWHLAEAGAGRGEEALVVRVAGRQHALRAGVRAHFGEVAVRRRDGQSATAPAAERHGRGRRESVASRERRRRAL